MTATAPNLDLAKYNLYLTKYSLDLTKSKLYFILCTRVLKTCH